MHDKAKQQSRIQNMGTEEFLTYLEKRKEEYEKVRRNNAEMAMYMASGENGKVPVKITLERDGQPKERNLMIEAAPLEAIYSEMNKQALELEESIKEDIKVWADKGW